MRGYLSLLSPLVALLVTAAHSGRAAEVPTGSDCLNTAPGDAEIQLDLPAGFIDVGSVAFSANVPLEGVPLPLPPSICAGFQIIWLDKHKASVGPDSEHGVSYVVEPDPFDTVVRRTETAQLPTVSSSDTIDIEILALSLKSVSPITVITGGSGAKLYEVRISLDGTNPSLPGSLQFTAVELNGPNVSGTLSMPNLPVNWVLDLVPLDGGPDPPVINGSSEFTSGTGGGTFETTTPVPAVREWGLVLLGLGLLAQMAYVIRRRLRSAAL